MSASAEEDFHGIQIDVKLHLRNGRYKKLIFRKHEHQLESFLAAVSPYNIKAELA